LQYHIQLNHYLQEPDETLVEFCKQHASSRTDYEAQPLVCSIISFYERTGYISNRQKMCLARFKYWLEFISPILPISMSFDITEPTLSSWLAPYARRGKEMVSMYLEMIRKMDYNIRVKQLESHLYRPNKKRSLMLYVDKED